VYFKYKALKGNKTVKRQIEAASVTSVIGYLQQNGYFPISVTLVKEKEDSLFSFISSKISFPLNTYKKLTLII